ncbi:MAG TPA: replicative DNA helicase, partial [Marinilabiliales bacterium]|nr:replicative DNA helicase [Marinilabiliales bacterium]
MAERKYSSNKNNSNQNAADFGKIPPQVVEFEEAVLGALMLEKDAVHTVIDILKPDCFYNDAHGKIFQAILNLSLEHKPIDIHTVSQQLKINGDIEAVGGSFYLAQITNKVASTAHLEYHARIIAQKYIQRELIRVGANIQTRAFEESDDVSDMLDQAERDLFNIAEGNIKREVSRIDSVIREAIHQIEEAGKRPDGLSGVPSGFTELDRITSGWQASDLVIIAARPAMGKTAFVLSMARNTAVDHKRPVAVF